MLVASACAHPPAQPTTTTAAVAADPVAALTVGYPESVRRDVETLRKATNAFHDLAAADAAGYPSALGGCAADSTLGGMGHHLIDRPAFDGKLDITHPEMLVYAPLGNGKVELVAVEYVVPYSVVPRTATAPRLFGQDLNHYDKFNYWELHVWAWRKNSAGLFADWNPEIKCPRPS